ncbi:MAG: DUF3575 domain-containing protein [Bacteroidota bacterium]
MSLIFHSFSVLAQDTKVLQSLNRVERTDALKINLLSPFYGTVNLAWQHVLSNDASFQLTMTYTDFDSYGSTTNTGPSTYGGSSSFDVNNQLTKGVTIVPEYRFVLNGRGLSGVYIAPFARYMYYEYHRDIVDRIYTSTAPYSYTIAYNELYTYHSLGLGVVVGKQFVFKNRVVFDLFAGPVYSILMASNKSITKTGDVVIGDGIPNTYIRGYGVRAGLTVGFLF